MDLSNKGFTKLPSFSHKKVDNFDCSVNELTDLIGSPDQVSGNFDCSFNKLTSLNGSSTTVDGVFCCSFNMLTSLIGAPKHVGTVFDCSSNKLTDLNGSPNYIDDFCCDSNQLTSLIGAPNIIKRNLYIRNNPSLLDISDIWDSDIGGVIFFNLNPGMAVLPLIKFEIYPFDAIFYKIHKKNLGPSKQNILDFQYDLIENGFADNAKWEPISN